MSFGLGSAHGEIRIDYDGSAVGRAVGDLGMLNSAGRNVGFGLQAAGLAVGAVGVGAGAAIKEMVTVAMDVEAGLKAVEASTGATGQTLEDLRQTVVDLGADTIFTSQEIVGAADAMAKAGITADELNTGVLAATSDLASATGESLGTAGKTMADAVNLFGLSGDQAADTATLITQAVNSSAIGLSQYQAGFRNLAPIMAGFADTSEESLRLMGDTGEAVSFFTSQGLKAADSGLSWSRVIQNIAAPTMEKYADALDEATISAFDANGEFRGTAPIMADINEALAGMSDEDMTRTIKSWGLGAEALDVLQVAAATTEEEYTAFVEQMRGGLTAQEAAAIRMEGLAGAIELFRGNVSAAMLEVGGNLLKPIELFVRGITSIVGAFVDLPAPIKQFIALATGITAVVFTAAGALLFGAGILVRFSQALRMAGFSLRLFLGIGALVSGGIIAGVLAYQTNFLGFADAVNAGLAGIGENLQRFGDQFKATFDAMPRSMGDVEKFFHAFAGGLRAIGGEDTPDFLVDFASTLDDVGDGIGTAIKKFRTLRARGLSPLAAGFRAVSEGLGEISDGNDALQFMADRFRDLSDFARDFGDAFRLASLDLSRMMGLGLGTTVAALGQALEDVTGLPVAEFAAELGGRLNLLQKYFQELTDSGMTPFEALLHTAFEGLELLTGVDLNGFFDRAGSAMERVLEVGGKVLGSVDDLLGALVSGDWERASQIIGNLARMIQVELGGALSQAVDWVLDVGAPAVGGWLMDHNPAQWLAEQIGNLLPVAGEVLGTVANWVMDVAAPRLGDWLAEHNPLSWLKEQLFEMTGANERNVLAAVKDWVFDVGAPTVGDWLADHNPLDWLRDTLDEMIPDEGDVTPMAALKSWALDVAAPTVVDWVEDMGAWVGEQVQKLTDELADVTVTFDNWTLKVAMPGDAPGTEKSFEFDAAAGAAAIREKLVGLLETVRVSAVPFANWALDILFPGEDAANSMGGPGERGEASVGDTGDWGARIFDRITGLIEQVKIEAIPFGEWAINIIAPSDEQITMDTDGLVEAISTRIESLIAVGSTFYSKAGEIGQSLGKTLGEAIAAGINAIFASQEAGPLDAALASGRGFGAQTFSFGDAFANFDTQFTESFQRALEPAFERIKENLRGWIEDKKTDLWNNLWQWLMEPRGPGSDDPEVQQAARQAAEDVAGSNWWQGVFDFIGSGGDLGAEHMAMGFSPGAGKAESEMATSFGTQMGEQFAGVMTSPEFTDAMQQGFQNADTANLDAAAVAFLEQMTVAISDAMANPTVQTGKTGGQEAGPGGGMGAAVANTMILGIANSFGTASMEPLDAAVGELVDGINESIDAAFSNFTSGSAEGGGSFRGGTAGSNPGTQMVQDIATGISAADAGQVETALKAALGVPFNTTLQDIQTLIALEVTDWYTEFSNGFTNISTAVGNGMTAFQNTMTTGMAQVQIVVANSMSLIKADFDLLPPAATTAGQGTSSGMAQGIGVMQAAQDAVSGAITAIVGLLESVRGRAFTAGAGVAEGFAAGMRSALGEITAAADAMVLEADRATKAKAEISSPSALFARHGLDMGLGLAEGLRAAGVVVSREMEIIINQIAIQMDAMADSVDPAAFSDVATGLQEMADAGALTIPAMQRAARELKAIEAGGGTELTAKADEFSALADGARGAAEELDTAAMSWREFGRLSDEQRAAAGEAGLLPELPDTRQWAEDFSAVRAGFYDAGTRASGELTRGVKDGVAASTSAAEAAGEYSSQFTDAFWDTTIGVFRNEAVSGNEISQALSAMASELKGFMGDNTPQEIVDVALALDEMAASGDYTAQGIQDLQEELDSVVDGLSGPVDGLVSTSNAMDTLSKSMARVSGESLNTELGTVYESAGLAAAGVSGFGDEWATVMANIQAFDDTEGLAFGDELLDTEAYRQALSGMAGDTAVAMDYFSTIFRTGLDAGNDHLVAFSDSVKNIGGEGGPVYQAARSIGDSIADGTFGGLQELKETLSPELYGIFAPALEQLSGLIAPAFAETGDIAGQALYEGVAAWWEQVKALMQDPTGGWTATREQMTPEELRSMRDMRSQGTLNWQERLNIMDPQLAEQFGRNEEVLNAVAQNTGTMVEQNAQIMNEQATREYQVTIPVQVQMNEQVFGEAVVQTSIGSLLEARGRNSVRRTGR